MKAAIEIRNLNVTIDATPILKDITVSLPAGKTIGLLGPSGAGKTTLMRAIVGRQKLTAGEVTVLGLPAGNAKLRHQVGYVTQAPSVYLDLTVHENLAYFAAMSNAPRTRIEEVIDEVSLGGHEKQITRSLSGGQLSRVSLAAALLGKPQLLILDEPTVGVDPLLRRELWRNFDALAKAGHTLLVSSHVMDEAGHCDELLLLRDGEILAHDTLEKLYEQTGTKDLEDTFLKLVEGKQ